MVIYAQSCELQVTEKDLTPKGEVWYLRLKKLSRVTFIFFFGLVLKILISGFLLYWLWGYNDIFISGHLGVNSFRCLLKQTHDVLSRSYIFFLKINKYVTWLSMLHTQNLMSTLLETYTVTKYYTELRGFYCFFFYLFCPTLAFLESWLVCQAEVKLLALVLTCLTTSLMIVLPHLL